MESLWQGPNIRQKKGDQHEALPKIGLSQDHHLNERMITRNKLVRFLIETESVYIVLFKRFSTYCLKN